MQVFLFLVTLIFAKTTVSMARAENGDNVKLSGNSGTIGAPWLIHPGLCGLGPNVPISLARAFLRRLAHARAINVVPIANRRALSRR